MQRRAIAFENIDVLLRRPIRLDHASLVSKLAHGQRGGYCFELNLLLADALTAIGVRNYPTLARVWLGTSSRLGVARVPPLTHWRSSLNWTAQNG